MRVKKLFARHYREIRDALKEDLEAWGEIPSGPFNTDPLLEPRLKVLSKNPEGWVEVSEITSGRSARPALDRPPSSPGRRVGRETVFRQRSVQT